MSAAAIFLDRDGTIMTDTHYPSAPDQVVLLPGAAEAIAKVNAARIPVVIVTNQSGIGRGLLSEAQYEAVHGRLVQLLREAGAAIDGSYHCPHSPDANAPCDCRKPGIGMHKRAAQDLSIDLSASVYVGDRYRDVEPAQMTGGLGLLIPGPNTPPPDIQRANAASPQAIRVSASITSAIDEAIRWIEHRRGPTECLSL